MRRGIRAGRSSSTWPCSISSRNNLSVEVAYIGLRGSHLPATLNMNQLGLESHQSRGERHDRVQLDGKRDHSAGAARLHVVTARHLLRGVSAADRAESVRWGRFARARCRRRPFSAGSCLNQFPHYTSANRAGIFRQEQLQRAAAAGGQALRRRRPRSARTTRSPGTTATWRR